MIGNLMMGKSIEKPPPNTKHQTPNTKHQTPNARYPNRI
ncbi:Dolichol-phosphate mannosyltransferase (EC in lipid-linked oligosaccharide synthesis cluster [Olavius algarvensis associated proteobacterium Delta 3]|nr:Dolichol-phosphate mannosyltransferase (EC in lipid-linked oligosaccharide synthesis cluster [Olavius algarvensis associated proteobacterium Delta 3]